LHFRRHVVYDVVCATDWGKMGSIIIKTKLRDFSY
jgi:hypothetical protein